ncbi:MAG TPA: hypothetical protein VJW93_15860 [Candidatus Acidoferrales bacterium]|nr:hypothetical protein [Candidatus Acidoferrales bacterium]
MKRTVTHTFHHPPRPVQNVRRMTSLIGFRLSFLDARHQPKSDLVNQLKEFLDIRSGKAICGSLDAFSVSRNCTRDLPTSVRIDNKMNRYFVQRHVREITHPKGTDACLLRGFKERWFVQGM